MWAGDEHTTRLTQTPLITREILAAITLAPRSVKWMASPNQSVRPFMTRAASTNLAPLALASSRVGPPKEAESRRIADGGRERH